MRVVYLSWFLFMGVSLMLVISIVLGRAALAESTSWQGQPIQVVSRGPGGSIPSTPFRHCNGGTLQVVHNSSNNNNHEACVFGSSGKFRIARYLTNQGTYGYLVAFAGGEEFYTLRGMCEGQDDCAYSQASDTLMLPTYINSIVSGMGFYTDVSRHISKQNNHDGSVYFLHETNGYPKEVMRGNRPAIIESATFSENGKWAAVELRTYGIARINMETFETRRVIAPGAEYGLGRDVIFELAISNDGSHIVVAGTGTGLQIYEIDESCGDTLKDDMQPGFPYPVVGCPYLPFDYNSSFPNFAGAHYPTFIDNDNAIKVAIDTRYGERINVVLAAGPRVYNANTGMLALGDSFTSGEGELEDSYYLAGTNSAPHSCHVSLRSYPYVLAGMWNVPINNVACSGARLHDIDDIPTEYYGQAGRLKNMAASDVDNMRTDSLRIFQPGIIPQASFVQRYAPALVTVGIGGNDAGFTDKLKVCLGLDTCEWAQPGEARAATAAEISSLYEPLRVRLRNLKLASPASKIALIGYPRLVAVENTCSGLVGLLLNQAERTFIDEAVLHLNTIMSTAAVSEGVLFINPQEALMGERLCEGKHLAMNGIRYGDDMAPIEALPMLKLIGSESFHPTPYGHELIANYIISQRPIIPQLSDAVISSVEQPPEPTEYWHQGLSASSSVIAKQISQPADEKIYKQGEVVLVEVPEMSLLSGSTVNVEIHSDKVALLSGEVDANGGFSASVTIPGNIPEGYHTIHVLSKNYAGAAVDIYKIIAVENSGVQEGAQIQNQPENNTNQMVLGTVSSSTSEPIKFAALINKNEPGMAGANGQVLGATKVASVAKFSPSQNKPNAANVPKLAPYGVVVLVILLVLVAAIWFERSVQRKDEKL